MHTPNDLFVFPSDTLTPRTVTGTGMLRIEDPKSMERFGLYFGAGTSEQDTIDSLEAIDAWLRALNGLRSMVWHELVETRRQASIADASAAAATPGAALGPIEITPEYLQGSPLAVRLANAREVSLAYHVDPDQDPNRSEDPEPEATEPDARQTAQCRGGHASQYDHDRDIPEAEARALDGDR